MIESNYSQHYGTYKTKEGTIIQICQSISDEHSKKSKKRKEPRNIYLENNVYKIYKQIKGKRYTFGKYDNLEEAIRARNYFQTKGWEKCIHEKDKFSRPEKVKGYFETTELY